MISLSVQNAKKCKQCSWDSRNNSSSFNSRSKTHLLGLVFSFPGGIVATDWSVGVILASDWSVFPGDIVATGCLKSQEQ